MRLRLTHPRMQLLFGLLSVADLSLTGWLLRLPGGRVYEANPVARWWLEQHGWPGLAGFKAGAALLTAGLALAISRRCPRAGGRVLAFGCAALVLVVLHSATLGRTVLGAPPVRTEEAVREEYQKLEGDSRKAAAFAARRRQLIEELAAGRCTLRAAAKTLFETERGRDSAWQHDPAGLYTGLSPRECMAANIILFAASRGGDYRTNSRLVRRLEQEFRRTFGPPLPAELRGLVQDALPGAYDAEADEGDV